ncbi:alpha-N-acetylgalactosaminide alpha-2,6-sialyltransferase 2-like isoform X2 [Acanthaster planci]|uniref:alpha-N-acetylgalactosaminide alpha-2,6-sialyltransferase n=1 Tax=Acanthaster planci TaxID=133434 RepID=A0A8B7XIJ4_ACAPL|nr:alpha-N-acetylgalactosaminide alpha-2,6-sialyltransferase 2-like isoform X2 [Acanthaster planci]
MIWHVLGKVRRLSGRKARLQSFLTNALYCYAAFVLAGTIALIHLQPQISSKQVILAYQEGGLESVVVQPPDSKVETDPLEGGIGLENPLGQAGHRTNGQSNDLNRDNQQEKRENHQSHPEQPKKCTRTIASLTKYSKWFHDRFKPNAKIFLDVEDLKNLRRISLRNPPYGYKGIKRKDVSDILLHENFTNPSVHVRDERQGCISCAVVGAGGILNGSGAGLEIDSHDYVFRMNQVDLSERFAEDVGKRTSFYTFYPKSQNFSTREKAVLAFYAVFKPFDVNYALQILNQTDDTNHVTNNGTKPSDIDPSRLKLIHPEFFLYVTKSFLSRNSDRRQWRTRGGGLRELEHP